MSVRYQLRPIDCIQVRSIHALVLIVVCLMLYPTQVFFCIAVGHNVHLDFRCYWYDLQELQWAANGYDW